MIIHKVYLKEHYGGIVSKIVSEKYFTKQENAESYKDNLLEKYQETSNISVFMDEIKTED